MKIGDRVKVSISGWVTRRGQVVYIIRAGEPVTRHLFDQYFGTHAQREVWEMYLDKSFTCDVIVVAYATSDGERHIIVPATPHNLQFTIKEL